MFSSNTSAVSADANYIEDVFSTWLYTGTGASQTHPNGIDLAGKGGLVWLKRRSSVESHYLQDSSSSFANSLSSNTTAAAIVGSGVITAVSSTGFTTSSVSSGLTYASWTFRKQPKFFDVVTYTGNGTAQNIAHSLGSVPGCIIVKSTSTVNDWRVYHRSLATVDSALRLNSTAAAGSSSTFWNSTAPTSTQFTVGSDGSVNANGTTYVAYLFAHNAGGFGLTGTDNVISCGSFTTDGSENSTTDLGYEPQWLLLKATAGGTAGSQPWHIFDGMRGLTVAGRDDASLQPNNSNAESQVNRIGITSTGFTTSAFGANTSFIYIAIRRGPMKVPTTGTSVFNPAYGTGATGSFDTSFPVDMGVYSGASISTGSYWSSRLTASQYLTSFNTNAEATFGTTQPWDRMEDWYATADNRFIGWGFRRAPGFFDEVCYTGTGAATTRAHNLGVVPELMISKRRSGTAEDWYVYHAAMGAAYYMFLNLTNAKAGPNSGPWNSTAPTSSVFSTGDWYESGATYVTYLFASCPGVSKCTAFTGTGALQTIDCGFTSGARFVLIKRTDSTGDWYVWDSSRGLSSSTDPYLLLNSTAAEVTSTNWVDTTSTGFQVTAASGNNVNISGASYIALAIA